MFLHDWWLPNARPKLVETISSQLSLTRPIATILANRRYENTEEVFSFLHPRLESLHDPFILPDMEIAVRRILRAVDEKEPIVIYGHDDVDGMTSALVLCEVIRKLQGSVSSYVPNRIAEGTGLSFDNVNRLAHQGAKLIVTVDCAVESRRIGENVHRLPLDIIITDHHEVHDVVPLPFSFVNPKRSDSAYFFRELSGVGVSFKLAQALLLERGHAVHPFFDKIGDLIALGTLADKVPLVDENRVFTRLGFELMNKRLRPGLGAIGDLFNENETIQTGFVMRKMIPILSSAHSVKGRNAGFDLLQTENRNRAAQIAGKLRKASQEWQQMLLESYQRILEQVGEDHDRNLILIVDERTPPGVLGATAAKLMRDHHCPAIMLSFYEDRYLGEGRAPKGIDLVDLLSQCRDLLITFGGHKQAAGFSLFPEYVTDFQERLKELIQDMVVPVTLSRRLDLETDLCAFDQRFFREYDLLAPFGRENPNPFFMCRGVNIKSTSAEELDEQYIGIGTVREFPLIAFRHQQEIHSKLKDHLSTPCDIVIQIVTLYGNTPHMLLRDLRRAEFFKHSNHRSSS